MTTIAGNGSRGLSGSGGPARTAQIGGPWGSPRVVTTDDAGNVFLANDRTVMRVDNDGVLTIVAGTAEAGYGGDGGPATAALLKSVNVLAVDARGNLFIADGANNRVRRVDEFGTITTVAGTGVAGFSGDGGPATQARLAVPSGLAFDAAGNTYVSDSGNNRIRGIPPRGHDADRCRQRLLEFRGRWTRPSSPADGTRRPGVRADGGVARARRVRRDDPPHRPRRDDHLGRHRRCRAARISCSMPPGNSTWSTTTRPSCTSLTPASPASSASRPAGRRWSPVPAPRGSPVTVGLRPQPS